MVDIFWLSQPFRHAGYFPPIYTHFTNFIYCISPSFAIWRHASFKNLIKWFPGFWSIIVLPVSWWHLTGYMGEKISLRQETLQIQLSYFSLTPRGLWGFGHHCASGPGDKGTHLPFKLLLNYSSPPSFPGPFILSDCRHNWSVVDTQTLSALGNLTDLYVSNLSHPCPSHTYFPPSQVTKANFAPSWCHLILWPAWNGAVLLFFG